MDAAYYEELAGRLYGLLTGVDDRITAGQARLLCHFTGVGEYGLALRKSPARSPRTRSPSPGPNAATRSPWLPG